MSISTSATPLCLPRAAAAILARLSRTRCSSLAFIANFHGDTSGNALTSRRLVEVVVGSILTTRRIQAKDIQAIAGNALTSRRLVEVVVGSILTTRRIQAKDIQAIDCAELRNLGIWCEK